MSTSERIRNLQLHLDRVSTRVVTLPKPSSKDLRLALKSLVNSK